MRTNPFLLAFSFKRAILIVVVITIEEQKRKTNKWQNYTQIIFISVRKLLHQHTVHKKSDFIETPQTNTYTHNTYIALAYRVKKCKFNSITLSKYIFVGFSIENYSDTKCAPSDFSLHPHTRTQLVLYFYVCFAFCVKSAKFCVNFEWPTNLFFSFWFSAFNRWNFFFLK